MLFSRKSVDPQELLIENTTIISKQNMNILGVKFEYCMKWEHQINNLIDMSKKSVYGLKRLRKFFSDQELLKIATSNIYSKLYYGSVLWNNCTTRKELRKESPQPRLTSHEIAS